MRRLLSPERIAVIGGGSWCANVVAECRKLGFAGEIIAVHPHRAEVGGARAVPAIADLPWVPDAAYVGVNRHETVRLIGELAALGCGGAICLASGFGEAKAELDGAEDLQAALVAAAGKMPILGPNCYGLINALDKVALWPDIHGCVPVERGIALVTQSSNIAINLTMQQRGLPIAMVVTAGNQAQVDLAEIGREVLADPRVTALGLHIEGIRDVPGLEALAAEARRLGKRIVALKIGASDQAQCATISHTGSLAGSDAGARALLARLGIVQVPTLSVLLETLKIFHVTGQGVENAVASLSCSGGEASLMADLGAAAGVHFPPLIDAQKQALAQALGPKVALANPLDYHTYIWGDVAAMEACFTAMMSGPPKLGVVVLDFPRADRCARADWDKVITAIRATAVRTGKQMAILASLVETMPEDVARDLIATGIIPLSGMEASLAAIVAAAARVRAEAPASLPPRPVTHSAVLSEAEAKQLLKDYEVDVPDSGSFAEAEAARAFAATRVGTFAVKRLGLAHKSEMEAVKLDIPAERVAEAARAMGDGPYLVERMITGGSVELLIGVTMDPAHGVVLTLGQGGVLTELAADAASLLIPTTPHDIRKALGSLRLAPVLHGYRGKPGIDMDRLIDTVMAVQRLVIAEPILELEINPLICGPDFATAADALIRLGEST